MMQRAITLTAFSVTIILGLAASTVVAQDDAASPDFLRDVAPVLTKYCAGCHNDEYGEGEFSVESFDSLQKGTANGPALLAGDAGNSRIIRVLTKGDPQMPPEGEPRPSAEQIAVLARWIDAGAKGPEGARPDPLTLIVPQIESHADRRPITDIAISPDGGRLAVARYGEVSLHSSSSGAFDPDKPTQRLSDLPGKVNSVHFTSDGERLITASGVAGLGGVAAIWDTGDGRLIREFRGHGDTLYDAELSPDETMLATCSYDHAIILWDAETGEQLRTLDGHNGAVYDVAFSPGGRFLVSASADETCKVWRVGDGTRLDTLGQPLKEQYTCTFSPDGKTIVAGGADNRIRVWRFISTDRPRINPLLYARFAHEGAVLRVAFTADGTRLVSSADDRTLKLWDTQDYTELRLWEDQPDIAAAVAIDDAGRSFLNGRMDGSLDRFPLEAASKGDRTVVASQQTTQPPEIVDAPLSKTKEVEPNDTAAAATSLDVPATVTGVLYRESDEAPSTTDGASPSARTTRPDFDVYRFESRAGQEWVIEVDAARSDSPVDAYIEVLTADGDRIERVLLQAVRDSYFTFRGKNADQSNDFRLFNWQEMTLNEYLYANGEVVKLWMYPRGPDSGYNVYPGKGDRWGFFDTTPLAHPLGEPCYIVQPHPPGAEIIPNGLPVFTLYYENDDESRRKLGNDSRIFFTAPSDGEYLVKVKDVRGFEGPDYRYSLTVRPRRPDFRVTLETKSLTIAPGNANEYRVIADRRDGYDGPITVELANLPEGFDATTPLVIEAGQVEAMGVLRAGREASAPMHAELDSITLTSRAEIGSRGVSHPVNGFEEIELDKQPRLRATILPAANGAQPMASPPEGPLEFAIAPGETIMLKVAVERNGHEGIVSFGNEFSGRNLPHGVYVDNIGLNGLLLLADQNEREFFITADHWVPEQTRTFHLATETPDGVASPPVVLHVTHPDSLAERGDQNAP